MRFSAAKGCWEDDIGVENLLEPLVDGRQGTRNGMLASSAGVCKGNLPLMSWYIDRRSSARAARAWSDLRRSSMYTLNSLVATSRSTFGGLGVDSVIKAGGLGDRAVGVDASLVVGLGERAGGTSAQRACVCPQ